MNGDPTRKEAALPSTTVQFVITYDQVTGSLNVNGPIQNAVFFFGVVEVAKDVVRKYIEANQSPIAKPGNLLSLQ